jgi:hypothetical protein
LDAWGLEWRRATRASLLRTLLLVRVKSVKWQQQKELCVASKWDEVVVLSPSLRENSAVAGLGRIVYASNVSRWGPLVAGGLVRPHRSHLGRSGSGCGGCTCCRPGGGHLPVTPHRPSSPMLTSPWSLGGYDGRRFWTARVV